MRFEDVLLSLTSNGQARLSEPQRSLRTKAFCFTEAEGRANLQAMRRPREVAKASGIPKSLIETSGAAGLRALRARRSAQERRQCARSAREISRTGDG
jgi:hypothetical protein